MNKLKFSVIIGLLAIVFSFSARAQDDSMFEKKGFVIISAGTNYDASLKIAKEAAKKFSYKLDLRDHIQNDIIGLTIPETVCEEHGFEFPAYIVRGRYDDGKYVSIEYTDSYEGFTPGYYIVVVASGSKGNKELTEALSEAKKIYKGAYIKYADVYQGCIH